MQMTSKTNPPAMSEPKNKISGMIYKGKAKQTWGHGNRLFIKKQGRAHPLAW